ncbi:hypothetical protein [Pseudorhodoferax sp. Leaf267]|uniref:hypothetical protein n=1 Tax=Pseudorhodoferax sp. Leaf267 TaxID=1736316 RepID=UPI0012E0DC8F|nr:hypothetical protein [Pseudorhodoferax sp. Leaf267]
MAKRERFATAPSASLLQELRSNNPYALNWHLREWLGDDEHRSHLYRVIEGLGGQFDFPSSDTLERECGCEGLEQPRSPPTLGHRHHVRLITRRDEIERILVDKDREYASRVYAELGGGSFMLALDPGGVGIHAEQRAAYFACFPHHLELITQLSEAACKDASVLSLRASDFDLAQFAQQAALRFCQKLMGYASTDYTLLESALGTAYRGLVHQVLGRHLVVDPLAIPAARQALGMLLRRTSALIEAYTTDDEDGLKGCDDPAVPANLQPVLRQLARHAGPDLNAEQRAIIAVGAAVGTVGNVQAAACIAVQALFNDTRLLQQARILAGQSLLPQLQRSRWQGLIGPALAANPPIPMLPRLKVDGQGQLQYQVLLALGGGTAHADAPAPDDPLIWGMPIGGPHWCAGKALAWPLVAAIVQQVMALPGLAQRLDAEDATVIGLKKRWGFACESYPLTHHRDRRLYQASLNVAMRLKSPVKDSAARVRDVLRAGAPRIEEALRTSQHVHFAWFELIESDTVLVLHTVYDGPFAAYIQHFALKAGDIFDALFECIQNPPPMPVDKFPDEFVAHIQRYNSEPAMGFFFSAYPGSDVSNILRNEWARP